MQQFAQCTLCQSDLQKTGFPFTTQIGGDFVVCTRCSSVYVVKQELDYSGMSISYLQPVQLPPQAFSMMKETLSRRGVTLRSVGINSGLSKDDATKLKRSIKESITVTDFLNSLEKEN